MQIRTYFDRTYVINLPQRQDRRKAIVQELENAGLPLTPGEIEIFPAIRPDSAGDFPNLGARGCFLSHLAIFKQAQAAQAANVLIIEDDLVISKYFQKHEASVVRQLEQTDWGLVFLGLPEQYPMLDRPVQLQPPSVPHLKTHLYGVNGKILDRLIIFLETLLQRPAGHPEGGPMHFDGALATFCQQNPDVLMLMASPSLGSQRSSRSDIADNAWFDCFPVFREVVTTARSARTWLSNQVAG